MLFLHTDGRESMAFSIAKTKQEPHWRTAILKIFLKNDVDFEF